MRFEVSAAIKRERLEPTHIQDSGGVKHLDRHENPARPITSPTGLTCCPDEEPHHQAQDNNYDQRSC